jgi:hypothetical protein
MKFSIPPTKQIRGDQLSQEIKTQTGIDVWARLGRLDSQTLEIPGADADAAAARIQAIIDAHTPTKTTAETRNENEQSAAAGAFQKLQAFVATPTPSGAQTTAAVKGCCAVAILLIRRSLKELEGT